ncbi:putative serine/threonine-protein kinase-like protein CCR3 [Rutidosis leptorrhynchoides]|uniref:putative serine/threonine-protein kinase-like protein CCR3 n=1 Tax=Rutidosis leptorrhynchoides TaxID=125765 RepID=UPI003A98D032
MTSLLSVIFILTSSLISSINALGGSATTLSVTYGNTLTVCGIVAGQPSQRIQCWRNGAVVSIFSNISFESIAGGRDVFCGIRSGGTTLVCWDYNLIPKRIYYNETVLLRELSIGNNQICAITNSTNTNDSNVYCWRNNNVLPNERIGMKMISSGLGVNCGIKLNDTNKGIICFGTNSRLSNSIQGQFMNCSMISIAVGGNHACGLNSSGFLICRGDNEYGQINVPDHLAFEFNSLALGANHTCALRRLNKSVVCWGGRGGVVVNGSYDIGNVSFETIVAGLDFTCGLTSNNFSVMCWGQGWVGNGSSLIGFDQILPGPCVSTGCECGIYPQSQSLCSGFGSICTPCDVTNMGQPRLAPPPAFIPVPPTVRTVRSRKLTRGLLAFAIVGSVGAVAGICSVIYCLWMGVCFGNKRIHNSVQPRINGSNNAGQNGSGQVSRSATIRRQLSRGFRRQRSGTSSKQADKEEEFTFADLALATNDFSLENKIGAGSFGVVYRGKLLDGREVAIKRSEVTDKTKKFQEKESAFDSELAFLSRLNHKHLVRLVGFCQERDERLLVYDYMKNGALFDHLHGTNNVEKSSSFLNSWKMRIKIALDASRGIEYLHNYAVPPIIHRDIKSSNILLDAKWVARVSDFGLSLMGPISDREFRPTKAAGTVGYIDPEYYGLNVLTAKSDVYGFGVVLLELLTGRRAIFKSNEVNGGAPISLVDYAVPIIMAGELGKILDKRVGPPEVNEAEAVELMAYTALHCVNTEGIYRPSMTDIVANLERALGLISDSHGSISGSISVPSD